MSIPIRRITPHRSSEEIKRRCPTRRETMRANTCDDRAQPVTARAYALERTHVRACVCRYLLPMLLLLLIGARALWHAAAGAVYKERIALHASLICCSAGPHEQPSPPVQHKRVIRINRSLLSSICTRTCSDCCTRQAEHADFYKNT